MNEKVIPIQANSYDTLDFVHPKCVSVYKKVGYTPLQVVEEIRPYLLHDETKKITYAGRLDPMAEGWMHVLWSGDVQEKNDLMNLDKTYEIEVVLGIQTDTSDALGIIESVSDVCEHKDVKSFIGPYVRPYPKYSSRNIKKTLKNDEPDGGTIAIQKGYIYDVLEKEERLVDSSGMEKNIFEKLSLSRMPGDFRMSDIIESWKRFFRDTKKESYLVRTLIISCASGTYMRTIAHDLGGFALSIKRIGFGKFVQMEK